MANDSELTRFTDEQIKEELRRRAAEEERLRKLEIADAVSLCRKEILSLSEFIPKHEFTSCNDANRANADRGCNRCIAIQVKLEYVEAVAHVRLVVVQ